MRVDSRCHNNSNSGCRANHRIVIPRSRAHSSFEIQGGNAESFDVFQGMVQVPGLAKGRSVRGDLFWAIKDGKWDIDLRTVGSDGL